MAKQKKLFKKVTVRKKLIHGQKNVHVFSDFFNLVSLKWSTFFILMYCVVLVEKIPGNVNKMVVSSAIKDSAFLLTLLIVSSLSFCCFHWNKKCEQDKNYFIYFHYNRSNHLLLVSEISSTAHLDVCFTESWAILKRLK